MLVRIGTVGLPEIVKVCRSPPSCAKEFFGLGFRVWGSGCRPELGFGVWDKGFWDLGLGFIRVWGQVQGVGLN